MAAILTLPVLAGGPAGAATFTVNSTADAVDTNPGDGSCSSASGCTLRAAIQEANALPGADTVTVPVGVYTLSIAGADEDAGATGDLDINDPLTLTGAGVGLSVIDGGGIDRVLDISSASNTVISGITVRNGSHPVGGGIRNLSTDTTMDHVSVESNAALADSSGVGGGIFLSGGTLTIDASTVANNSASGYGGGIFVSAGTLDLRNSTVSQNFADPTIVGWGGGIINYGGALYLTNVTVSGNTGYFGAGVFMQYTSAVTSIESSTIAFNSNPYYASGGGIFGNGWNNHSIRNTIIANNTPDNCYQSWSSAGHNISSDVSCYWSNTGDLGNTDPLLDVLADNGGATYTHALQQGSPAIDAADAAGGPATDQRGIDRPVDGDLDGSAVPDIGAFEFSVTNTPPTTNPLAVTGTTISWTYNDTDGDPQSGYEVEIWTGAGGSGSMRWSTSGTGTQTSVTYPTLPYGQSYYARVRANDGTAWGPWSETAFTFTGTLQVLTPNGGEMIGSGSTYTITWNLASGALPPAAPSGAIVLAQHRISYSLDGGSTWTQIASGITGSSYDWQVPVVRKNMKNCLIKVVAYEPALSGPQPGALSVIDEDTSDAPFTIFVVQLLTPNGGETLKKGGTAQVTWRSGETAGGVFTTVLQYTCGGGWSTFAVLGGNPGNYSWSLPKKFKGGSRCKVKVMLRGTGGARMGADASDGTLVIQ